MKIEVHHLSDNPTAAWNELSKIQKVIKVKVTPPKSNVPDDKVRPACGIHCDWKPLLNVDRACRLSDSK